VQKCNGEGVQEGVLNDGGKLGGSVWWMT